MNSSQVVKEDADDSDPCVGCTLCCDGTLYGRARTSPAEVPRVLDHGLEVFEADGSPYFPLPCRRQQDTRCAIYADRFDKCLSFKCALLRSYQRRETTLAQARSHIATTVALRRRVAELDANAIMADARSGI